MIRLFILMIVAIALVACRTPYQNMGLSGGVAAQRMTSSTYRIMARGNSFTSAATVRDYMMLKAAETTKSAGGTHFVVLRREDASRVDTIASDATAVTTIERTPEGTTTRTEYTPPLVVHLLEPGEDAYIRIVVVAKGERPPAGAVSADEVIRFVGLRVKRG